MLLAIILSLLATVPATINSVSYSCDGVRTTFPVTYSYVAQTDLIVTSTTAGNAQTTLALTTDYTLNVVSTATTATLTLQAGSRCPSGSTLKILRSMVPDQKVNLRTQGPYNPVTLEAMVDKTTMLIQQVTNGGAIAPLGQAAVVADEPIIGNGVTSNHLRWDYAWPGTWTATQTFAPTAAGTNGITSTAATTGNGVKGIASSTVGSVGLWGDATALGAYAGWFNGQVNVDVTNSATTNLDAFTTLGKGTGWGGILTGGSNGGGGWLSGVGTGLGIKASGGGATGVSTFCSINSVGACFVGGTGATPGLMVKGGGTNGDAGQFTGTGSGNGVTSTGGPTAGSYAGSFTGGGTSSHGAKIAVSGSAAHGLDINTTSGVGVQVTQIGTSTSSGAGYFDCSGENGGIASTRGCVFVLGNGASPGMVVQGNAFDGIDAATSSGTGTAALSGSATANADIGVLGATTTGATGVGVKGNASSTTGSIGVYGNATANAGTFAGWFNGEVTIDTTLSSATNKDALVITAKGTGTGITVTGGNTNGRAISATGVGTGLAGAFFAGSGNAAVAISQNSLSTPAYSGLNLAGSGVPTNDPTNFANGDLWVSGSGAGQMLKARVNGATNIISGNPLLIASQATAYSINSGSYINICGAAGNACTTETDSDSGFVNTTGVYTVPTSKGGAYQASCAVTFNLALTATDVEAALYVNGSLKRSVQTSNPAAGQTTEVSAVLNIPAGQTTECRAFQNSGAGKALVSNAGYNYFTLKRLSD